MVLENLSLAREGMLKAGGASLDSNLAMTTYSKIFTPPLPVEVYLDFKLKSDCFVVSAALMTATNLKIEKISKLEKSKESRSSSPTKLKGSKDKSSNLTNSSKLIHSRALDQHFEIVEQSLAMQTKKIGNSFYFASKHF